MGQDRKLVSLGGETVKAAESSNGDLFLRAGSVSGLPYFLGIRWRESREPEYHEVSQFHTPDTACVLGLSA